MANRIDTLTDQAAAVGDLVDELLLTLAGTSGPDAEVDPRTRTDDRLRELLVGMERVTNAAQAVQAGVMVALAEEASALDAAEFAASGLPSRSHAEFVPDEVAVLLSCTTMAASRRYGLALRLVDHPALHEAWRAGAIDARKVQVITDELAALADPQVTVHDADERAALAEQLAAGAIEYAQSHTWSQTRAWLRRRVLGVAPEIAELRRGRAERDRRVEIQPADDGMSELWALLSSVEARQIQQALTTAAHDLGARDGRTMDQRRADLLVGWMLGPDHAPTVHLHVVAETDVTADPELDTAVWLLGAGPLTELQASEMLGSAGRVVVEPHSVSVASAAGRAYRPSIRVERAMRARDVTCRFPGCRRAALGAGSGTDLDHTVPWPAGPTEQTNLAVLCRHHHRLKHSPGWQVVQGPDGSMTWTTPSGRTFTSEPWHTTTPLTSQESVPRFPSPLLLE
jgi:hypothetical protein